ncbi:MAG: HAD family hydrolase [Deltaproteobacteria bacterium]|nr:HAD family hydrolase [Deltaproteobacteria bacterium]
MTHNWQAIFFDFDGVILDTTRIKTAAFAAMYAAHGAVVVDAVVAYHREHGGISRYIKLCHFEEEILHRPVSDERLEGLAKEFSRRVLEGVLSAPFVPGAEATLRQVQQLGLPAFVVSGTPTEELTHVLRERELEQFLAEIHGSPPLKPVIIRDILARHSFEPQRCLFFGDALTDLYATRETGLQFFAVEPPGEEHLFGPEVVVHSEVFLPCRESV